MPTSPPIPRTVHPLAWWGWAMGVAIATTQSPGIVSTVLLLAAILAVVAIGHTASPFARVFPSYLALAGIIVGLRIVFYAVVGIKSGNDVILPLPRIPLPGWAGGIELFGPLSFSALLSTIATGIALAALLLCFGAAMALTDPQRTLRSLPASLHLLGTATVIALTFAPQLIESWSRVRRAQGLRGVRVRGWRATIASTTPVMHDALDRSIALAASMDSRGYARTRVGRSRWVPVLLVLALIAAVVGSYTLLDGTAPATLSILILFAGASAAILGSVLASRRVIRTRYRPDRWRLREFLIIASGVGVATLSLVTAPATVPGLTGFSPVFLLAAALAAAPIALAVSR